uniref:Transmembrane 9 superfamily member n=1 Tax=Opuntia streptacantha TaxID=393608 RepID=A0A7C9E954_OPUST
MPRIPVFLLMTAIISMAALFNFWVFPISSSPLNHGYNVGDQVPLFANKVGPLNNPSETYEYFDLPFCPPDKLIRRRESLGEVINGDRLTNTRYDINFRENKVGEIVCTKTLGRKEVVRFRNAIQRDSYFQMCYDDLPFWGFIGKVEGESSIPDLERPRRCRS